MQAPDDKNTEFVIRLHETSGGIGEYAALSCIWGGPQTYRTVSGNLDEYRQTISFSALPQTTADAVRCTHQLGLKYLWVDSFCIVQDSETDKKREISRIASIYRNAHVTISVAKALHCAEGFLQPRAAQHNLFNQSFRMSVLCPKNHDLLSELCQRYRENSKVMASNHVDHEFAASVWGRDNAAWFAEPSTFHLASTS